MFSNPAPVLSSPAVAEILRMPPLAVLEVGAGCLRNALHLLRIGHKITVLEVPGMRQRFPEQYEELEELGGAIVQSLPPHLKFDLVIMTFVIETICSPKERTELLLNISRHLTPVGSLVISARGPRDLLTAENKGVRCNDGYVTPNRSFARSYTKAQMKKLLSSTGFKNLDFLHKQSSTEPEYLHVIARKRDE
jgi:hypothetical protein